MTDTSPASSDRWPRLVHWSAMIALSAVLGATFLWCGLPAALLLGPMLAAIAFTAGGIRLHLTNRAFAFAQGVIGCMIARMLPASISHDVLAHWQLFIMGVLSVIAISVALGWTMTRMRLLPGTTVMWGLSPGAATVMTLMAENYGADVQIVALMQYLRVVMVTATASIAAKMAGVAAVHSSQSIGWFQAPDWVAFAQTLALVLSGPILARWLKFSAGALLIPLALGLFLIHRGWMTIELPPLFLALAYASIGWRVGTRFTRPLLLHAARMLPRVLLCTLLLIALCAGLGGVLAVTAGLDPMTAYLATSPGGADAAAIIAASSHVDKSFVMATQVARAIFLLVFGPTIARLIARYAGMAPSSSVI